MARREADPTPPGDIEKDRLFRELGYAGDPSPYETALAEAGLSNPRKSRIASSKRQQVRALFESRFFRVCSRGDCRAEARGRAAGRSVVEAASAADCAVCGGSVNRRSVDELVGAAERAGVTRLCIVGGSPATRLELGDAIGDRLALRFVDGTAGHSRAQADTNIAWAGLVVVWGATQLDHKVSILYKGPNVVVTRRRGIADLAAEAKTWLEARSQRG